MNLRTSVNTGRYSLTSNQETTNVNYIIEGEERIGCSFTLDADDAQYAENQIKRHPLDAFMEFFEDNQKRFMYSGAWENQKKVKAIIEAHATQLITSWASSRAKLLQESADKLLEEKARIEKNFMDGNWQLCPKCQRFETVAVDNDGAEYMPFCGVDFVAKPL